MCRQDLSACEASLAVMEIAAITCEVIRVLALQLSGVTTTDFDERPFWAIQFFRG
jgi:hypothetical protein